ncbi:MULTISPECIES: hypothetical protein [Zoogloea]|uniref:Major facilitator superfamily (MFS) profile domain-containing protein n=1 Tax=Zoogloea oleivorans TaxID=1552750 RepID=A0A6C2CK13_9RHOO|nr:MULTISPECIES: hypothetical protein [Zoogloea]MBT9499190.1 hypothetical protein [Zoogloea sp.]MDD2666967.1 hypothetical protein [Zoogloea sp.]MDY0035882.1 hypothetical protein [Zoogloea oleivorans]TYC54580.1 hypothetical protein ETQ85_18035 [Zoogloea oleivorans]
MLILRIVAVLVGIGIGASVFAFLFTREPRYLTLAWRLFRFGLVVALIFFALLILERVLVPLV